MNGLEVEDAYSSYQASAKAKVVGPLETLLGVDHTSYSNCDEVGDGTVVVVCENVSLQVLELEVEEIGSEGN